MIKKQMLWRIVKFSVSGELFICLFNANFRKFNTFYPLFYGHPPS